MQHRDPQEATGEERTLSVGELVAAAFDQARRMTRDPAVASRLAAEVLRQMLVQTGNGHVALRLARGDV